MSKVTMRCPFSGKACKDCAIYRGRHFYLCFYEEYRVPEDQPMENAKQHKSAASRMRSSRKFEMPKILISKTYDPFSRK